MDKVYNLLINTAPFIVSYEFQFVMGFFIDTQSKMLVVHFSASRLNTSTFQVDFT